MIKGDKKKIRSRRNRKRKKQNKGSRETEREKEEEDLVAVEELQRTTKERQEKAEATTWSNVTPVYSESASAASLYRLLSKQRNLIHGSP